MEELQGTITSEPLCKEYLEHTGTYGTYLDPAEACHLTKEHSRYLMQGYGTLDLDPLPLGSDADPYNWPASKVMFTTPFCNRNINEHPEYTQPSVVCSFPCMHVSIHRRSYHPNVRKIAQDLGVSLHQAYHCHLVRPAAPTSQLSLRDDSSWGIRRGISLWLSPHHGRDPEALHREVPLQLASTRLVVHRAYL
jgi:hypothetical protein